MSYLVDTDVLSELRRRNANTHVVTWFEQRNSASLYLSVLTLGEIRAGIDGVADQHRRQRLLDWLEYELPNFFAGRVLAVDAAVADRWGRLASAAKRPLPAVDSLLAATAIEHDLRLVTRNERHFSGFGVEVINPWKAG